MKRHAFVLALALLTSAQRTVAQSPDRALGLWQGTLDVGAAKLRLGLVLERDSAKALTATMVSIDQGNAKIPGAATLQGDSVIVTIAPANAQYRAVMNAAGDSLIGTFTQGAPFALVMRRVTAFGSGPRPQEPKVPFPYRTKDVSYESAPGVRMAGTLVIPNGPGPFPAVVFSTGSGPQNRDEEIMGHKPFLVIADYLARRGIASLRSDDRGVAKSTGNYGIATSADFATDVEAAVKFLRADSAIDARHVGIIGHSEGGLIGPIVAARSRDVAFLVMLAGPGLAGDSILYLQGARISKASGMPDADIARAGRFNHAVYGIAKSDVDSATAMAQLRPIVAKFATENAPAGQNPEMLANSIMSQTAPLLLPWYRYFLRYDPRPALRKVKVPVLALNGTLDLQVPYRENLDAIRSALKDAGNKDVELVEMPGLNHLFQPATTGLVTEYANIEVTFSPAALDRVATWILAHAKR